MRRVIAAATLVLLAAVVAACGDSPPSGGEPRGSVGEAWWVLDTPEFRVVDSAIYPEGQGPAGHRWTLEYSSGPKTLQITAFEVGSGMRNLVDRQPRTGEATVDGHTLTIRRSAGIPDDEIPPQFGADWEDSGLLIQFGGTDGEPQIRELLRHLHRVDRNRWEAEAGKAPQLENRTPSPSSNLTPRPPINPTAPINPTTPQPPRASTTATRS